MFSLASERCSNTLGRLVTAASTTIELWAWDSVAAESLVNVDENASVVLLVESSTDRAVST